MAKGDHIKETILMLPRIAGADTKRRKAQQSRAEETFKIKDNSTRKVYDMRSRRLVQRLRDEVLDQLMNSEVKPKS